MKKVLVFILSLLVGVGLVSAITLSLSSGEKLDNSNWQNLSGILNKVNTNNNNAKISGNLMISGSLCNTSGKCLDDNGSIANPGLSCSDLLDKGITENGTYYIKPDGYSGSAYPVYCDMTTDGGGWTLVSAQFESDPVTNWNEGIQSGYDPFLVAKKGFALSTLQIPANSNQTAFGKSLDPTFVGYSDFKYTTGDIDKTLLYNKKTLENFHIYRNISGYYSAHDPDFNFGSVAVWNNTLTYDKVNSASYSYSWAFSPNQTTVTQRSYSMNGTKLRSISQDYAWTVWVREGNTTKGSIVNPGLSCKNILDSGDAHGDGVYRLDVNGGSNSDAFQAYCDMTEDLGGWTLVGVNGAGSNGVRLTSAYNTPILSITNATDWKYSDSVINSLKGGTESNINGFRITYNKAKNSGTFYKKRYFWARSCNFNASQKANTNGKACIDWSVEVNSVGTYAGGGDGGWYGLQRRIYGRNNLGWDKNNIIFACYEGSNADGANQTGYCGGVSTTNNVSHYMWVR